MATTKPAAKPAAPAAKKAAPAAKPAAKAVAKPAPAPEPAAEEAELAVGSKITFTGYGEDVPAEEQFLTANEVYEVAGFTEAEGDDPGGDPYVLIPNADFNPKKKESDENPKLVAVVVVEGEYELAEEVVEEEVAAPAPATKTAAKGKKAAAAAEPAPAAKGKAVGKKAAAKAEPEPEPEPEVDADDLPDLEGEDEAVLELVNGDRNLIEVAQELESAASQSEYRMGGVLYHIRKSKAHREIEGGEAYAEKGGFEKFLEDYFNVGYRKAMYLIDIYHAFTVAGIENPAEKVAAMGWAKAAKIARPMMAEDAKVEDLIELADNNTLADLSTAIKEQVTVGGTKEGGTKVTRTTLKFRLMEQDGATAVGILDAVQATQSLKDAGEALMFILNDWASVNIPKSAAKAAPKQTAVGKPVAKKAAAKA